MVAAPDLSVRAGDGSTQGQGGSQAAEDRLPKLVLIPPGTKIGTEPPKGWSHLVIKSIPRLASGDMASLPAVAKSTATTFRTVVLADVRREEGTEPSFVLRRVGLGICMSIGDVDTVVSMSQREKMQVPLGLISRRVLVRAEEELAKGRLRARTPTFALYSTPTLLRVKDTHVPVLLRYAILVDPATGAVRTFLWSFAEEPADRRPASTMVLLPTDMTFDCRLDVRAERLLETVPTFWSFALADLPSGQSIKLSPELQAWTLRDRLPVSESATLEVELRGLLDKIKPEPTNNLATRPAEGRGQGAKEAPKNVK
jgi:hypothetical protein